MKQCTKCNEIKDLTKFYKLERQCRSCRNEYAKKWSKENRKRRRASEIKYALKHPELLRKKFLKRDYGISLEDYDIMAKNQNNLCYICKNPETQRPHLCVDHDHENGNIRGLLCNNCNRALGLFKDNLEILENAFNYLKSHSISKKR